MTSRYRDPTITRKPPRPSGSHAVGSMTATPTVGRLVDRGGDGVWLVTDRGERSRFHGEVLQGSYGNALEGEHRAPRVWQYAADGVTPTVEGDVFLVVYLENNPKRPVLIPGVRPTRAADPEFFPPDPIGQDPNPMRSRKVSLDGSGGIDGHVQITSLDGGTSLEIEVGGGAFGSGLRIELDYDAGKIRIGQGRETEPVPLGHTLLVGLKAALDELRLAALAIPYTLAPPPAVGLLDTLVKIDESLAGQPNGGPPYLSDTVEIE